MKTSLTTSLLVLVSLLCATPIACMYLFSEVMVAQTEQEASVQLQETTLSNAIRMTSDFSRMCSLVQISNNTFSQSVQKTLFNALKKLGSPALTKETFEREVREQSSSQSRRKEKIQLLKFGKTVVDCAQKEVKNDPINKILNELKERLKCDFTIFMRVGSTTEFLRLASTYSDSLGENIAGSYISPKSSLYSAQVIDAIINKTEYSGLVSTPSTTISVNYTPIINESGDVIGALFFGMENSAIRDLNKYISTSNIGKNSRAWVIDDSMPDNPILKFSERQAETNVNINNETSTSRKNITYEIIEKSRALKPGQVGYEIFTSKSDENKKTLLTYAYYRPWKWIIGTVTDAEEFTPSATIISENLKISIYPLLKNGIIICAIVFVIVLLLSNKTVKDFKFVNSALEKLANSLPSNARSQIEDFEARGNLLPLELVDIQQSLKPIAKHLENTIDDINRDIANLAKDTSRITTISEEIDEIGQAENSQMKDISKSGRNILFSSEALNKTVATTATEIQKSLNLSRDGENAIDSLMRKYDALATASNNVAKKLSAINDNAEKITAIISTIFNVSIKTNLLSLNASIEAEKVGESGLGFAVVSRQIRTLAGETTKAAQSIEQIVRQMQSSVNAAVMEMDKFSASMRENSIATVETAKKLESTILNIEAIKPKFENISKRISELSKIAVDITFTIKNLSVETVEIHNSIDTLQAINVSAKNKTQEIKETLLQNRGEVK